MYSVLGVVSNGGSKVVRVALVLHHNALLLAHKTRSIFSTRQLPNFNTSRDLVTHVFPHLIPTCVHSVCPLEFYFVLIGRLDHLGRSFTPQLKGNFYPWLSVCNFYILTELIDLCLHVHPSRILDLSLVIKKAWFSPPTFS